MKRGVSLSFMVGTIGNGLVMEIGWTDVGSGGYILVSCAHSNTSYIQTSFFIDLDPSSTDNADNYAQLDSLCLSVTEHALGSLGEI